MNIYSTRHLKMELFSKILDSDRDEQFIIKEVNFFDGVYSALSDSLYTLNMKKVGESYDYDSELDMDNRKKLVDGMVFANLKLKEMGTIIENYGPNQRLSYVLSKLPVKNNKVSLDSFKEDYFRYGIMVESLIGSFHEFPQIASKKGRLFKTHKKNYKKNKYYDIIHI